MIYLFDFKFVRDSNLVLFGYVWDGQNWVKAELAVEEFEIALQMNVDCNLFHA